MGQSPVAFGAIGHAVRGGQWHALCRLLAGLAATVGLIAASACWAQEPDVVNGGFRARIGGERVLGKEQPEAFHEWDVWASFRLPWWTRYGASGFGVGTRMLASVGVMKGAESNALVVSVLPLLAFGSRDGRYNFDMGMGGALLSQHRFAQQDYGGTLQFALTAGVSAAVFDRWGVGYRFMHYSDAGLYGSDTIGADFHMLELIYRF